MKLSAENVTKIFDEALAPGIELHNFLEGTGMSGTKYFNGDVMKAHEADIVDMLNQLPDEFFTDGGGGWTFLNMCQTKDGEQWTGLHQTMDQLFILGNAIGKAAYLFPRNMWSILPGEMPFITIQR